MERAVIERLFYGAPGEQRRFTQDFPILPDVWIEFGEHPDCHCELLLTPHNQTDAPTLARALRGRLQGEDARILFNGSVVLAEFTFRQLMRVAMPLTSWWARSVARIEGAWTRKNLISLEWGESNVPDLRLLKKLVNIVGAIECERQGHKLTDEDVVSDEPTQRQLEGFADVFENLDTPREKRGLLWSINRNRPSSTTVWRSRNSVKADAAARLFEVNTDNIRWAVLDTGVDAKHPAFARRNAKGKKLTASEPDAEGVPEFPSRVVRTYDFLRFKWLVDPDAHNPTSSRYKDESAFRNSAAPRERGELAARRAELRKRLESGREIDWYLIEPFLRIPHTKDDYKPPEAAHGTHVAGIIAADWPEAVDSALEQPVYGLCPKLEIYDIRVLGKGSDEFTIISALQFIRHLNAHKDLMMVHGVNLSVAVVHDVTNYACGRTPICEECERVVNAGVVVVTAAGNRGFNRFDRAQDGASGDYRFISITDPGNAESVITVGSTHRYMPHSYGVSYFSSRGPTGDGRTKPDLVAPGERIDSCSLSDDYETMDGTSQAAPHVSGAAALLVARHRELIGQPKRVKEILCKSATDLGREPRFQGAGMLDVLRALQSV